MTHPFGPMTCLPAPWVSWGAQRTWSPRWFPSFHLISVIYCTAVNYIVGKHVSRFKDVCAFVCLCSQDWWFLLRWRFSCASVSLSFVLFFGLHRDANICLSEQTNIKLKSQFKKNSDEQWFKKKRKKKRCLHSIRTSKSVCFRMVANECCVPGMKTLKCRDGSVAMWFEMNSLWELKEHWLLSIAGSLLQESQKVCSLFFATAAKNKAGSAAAAHRCHDKKDKQASN